jgi:hypothetical protein
MDGAGGHGAGRAMELSAFICSDARIAHDGRLELSGVFNELYAPAFPARQDRLVLVALLVWDASEHGRVHFRVDLAGPDEKSVYTVDGHTEVALRSPGDAPPKTQLVLPLHNVMFPSAGRYRFVLQIGAVRVLGPSLFVCEEAPRERL